MSTAPIAERNQGQIWTLQDFVILLNASNNLSKRCSIQRNTRWDYSALFSMPTYLSLLLAFFASILKNSNTLFHQLL